MRRLAGFALALLVTTAAYAADDMADMDMGHSAGDAPSTAAYQKAMHTMHRQMDIDYTGNADADFVAGMIPHHQGAVDMAKTELQYGKDPALRKLATGIVAAQEKEIRLMKQWQASHPAQ